MFQKTYTFSKIFRIMLILEVTDELICTILLVSMVAGEHVLDSDYLVYIT